MRVNRNVVCAIALSASLVRPAAASVESELNGQWRGAWTVIRVEAFSSCSGNYTNNEVIEGRVHAKSGHRFGRGELATVQKINLKRKRVEVFVDLTEPLLVSRIEGPFTLYDELQCHVELQIKLPRSIDSSSTRELSDLIEQTLERFDGSAGSDAARDSASWNGRLREAFPEDYEETLYQFEIWRAEHVNRQVAAKIEDSVEEAGRLVDRLDDDPDYLDGFAKGVERARKRGLDRDCDRLLSASKSSFVRSESGDTSREFRDGHREGQELVFHLEMARRLKRCFVPPPL